MSKDKHEKLSNQPLKKKPTNILELFQNIPDKENVALEWLDENSVPKTKTFSELVSETNHLAYHLKSSLKIASPNKVSQETINEIVVGIHLERNNPNWVIFTISVWKAGGAILLLDKTLTKEAIENRATTAGCSFIVSDELEKIPEGIELIEPIETLEDSRKYSLSQSPLIKIDQKQLAYIAFTSGSTGKPKGIAINHEGIVPLTEAHKDILELNYDDRILQFSGFSFDASLMELFMMMSGSCLVLPKNPLKLEHEITRILEQREITTVILVPSVIVNIKTKPMTLKKLISTGEAITKAEFNYLLKLNNDLLLVNGYGPSECTVGLALQKFSEGNSIVFQDFIRGNEWMLIDTDKTPTIETETTGELAISGCSLARGYITHDSISNDKRIDSVLTDKAFFKIGDKRYYRTGDIATVGLINGKKTITSLKRTDRQLKMYGVRYELPALQKVMLGILHNEENKKDFKCVKRLLLVWRYLNETQTRKAVFGILIFENFKTITTDISKHLIFEALNKTKYFLSERNLFPKDFFWVELSNPSFKTTKGYSYKKLANATNKNNDNHKFLTKINFIYNTHIYKKPDGRIEELMCNIWQKVLELDNDFTFDVTKFTFKELGGSSLAWQKLIKKIEETLNMTLSITAEIKKDFTIRELCIEVVRQKLYQNAWVLLGHNTDNNNSPHPPLFLVHPVSGAISEFNKNNIDGINEQQKYALLAPLQIQANNPNKPTKDEKIIMQCQDYYLKYALCKSMGDIAHYATLSMKRIQRVGPYYIAGYSFGSQLAFEIARRLQAERKKIAYLGILDGASPGILSQTMADESNRGLEQIQRVFNIIANGLGIFKEAHFKANFRKVANSYHSQRKIRTKVDLLFLQFNKTLDIILNSVRKKQSLDKPEIVYQHRILITTEYNIKALHDYNPTKFNNKETQVVIYKTGSKSTAASNLYADAKKWKEFFTQPSEITIPENFGYIHMRLLQREDLKEAFSQHINSTLKKYQPTSLTFTNVEWKALKPYSSVKTLLLISNLLSNTCQPRYLLQELFAIVIQDGMPNNFTNTINQLLSSKLLCTTKPSKDYYKIDTNVFKTLCEERGPYLTPLTEQVFERILFYKVPKELQLCKSAEGIKTSKDEQLIHLRNQCVFLKRYFLYHMNHITPETPNVILQLITNVFTFAMSETLTLKPTNLPSLCFDYVKINSKNNESTKDTHNALNALKDYLKQYKSNKTLLSLVEKHIQPTKPIMTPARH